MHRILLGCVLFLVACTTYAEIYKWKNKDGRMQYSDTPPPSNIRAEPILGKNSKSVASPLNSPANIQPPRPQETLKPEAGVQQAKEQEKQKAFDATRQAELKYRQESCQAARKNLAIYASGGRVMTTDEKGERRYLGEEELAIGKADAQAAVDKYCD